VNLNYYLLDASYIGITEWLQVTSQL